MLILPFLRCLISCVTHDCETETAKSKSSGKIVSLQRCMDTLSTKVRKILKLAGQDLEFGSRRIGKGQNTKSFKLPLHVRFQKLNFNHSKYPKLLIIVILKYL